MNLLKAMKTVYNTRLVCINTSVKHKIWGCRYCSCLSGQQHFTFATIERAKENNKIPNRQNESTTGQCLKQHVEGEINKQNIWKTNVCV